MVRSSVKSFNFKKRNPSSRQKLARAAKLLSARAGAPLRTGGWFAGYGLRGRNELKSIDVSVSPGNITSTARITLLSGVSQGTDYTQRIGRKIMFKSMLLRWMTQNVTVAGASDANGDIMRVLCIQDLQSNGSSIATTDVLQSNSVLSPMNLNNRDRFKVLFDKIVTLGDYYIAAATLTTGCPVPKFFKKYKKLFGPQIFGNTAGGFADITSGSIWLIELGTSAVATYEASWYSRIRFSDS